MARSQPKPVEETKPAEEIPAEIGAPVEEPTAPAVEDAPAPAPVEEDPQFVADEYFTDSLTGRSFKKGDVVSGWDRDRLEAYTRRGLLSKVGPSLTAETGPSEVA